MHFHLCNPNELQWYGHVSKRDNDDVLRRALDFEVTGRKGRGQPNMTWKRQVEEYINQIRPKREDVIRRVKWRNGVFKLSRKHKVNPATCVNADKTRFKNLDFYLSFVHLHCLPQRFTHQIIICQTIGTIL